MKRNPVHFTRRQVVRAVRKHGFPVEIMVPFGPHFYLTGSRGVANAIRVALQRAIAFESGVVVN